MTGVEYHPIHNGARIPWDRAEHYGKNNLTFEAVIDGETIGTFDQYLEARIAVHKNLTGAVELHRALEDSRH